MLSFIIPAHDEEPLIGSTLRAIHEAAATVAAPYEVIVVDDASTDRTAVLAEAAGARVVRIARRQISAARNAGAAVAQGDVLLFVDADTLVNPDAVRGAMRAVQKGAVGGGAAVRLDEPTPRLARLLLPLTLWLSRLLRLAGGCFFFCTRRAFDAAGGFDERVFVAEEIGLGRALRRLGPFVILRESVLTSARKLRTHSGWELAGMFLWVTIGGKRALRDRSRLDLWYAPRRKDTAAPR